MVLNENVDKKHTVLIAFNNYLRPNMPDKYVIHSWFGDHENNIDYKDIEMYEIFLPKFYNMCYHKDNKINKRLSIFGATSYNEMKNFTSNKDELYIIEELIRLGKMDEFIDEYDHEIVIQKLINTYKIEGHEAGMAEGKNEGRIEGIAEGDKNKQIEIAKKMLEKKI